MPSAFTSGRFTVAWCDNEGMRDMPALTSQVSYMRTHFRYGDQPAALILLAVAEDEVDAAVEKIKTTLSTPEVEDFTFQGLDAEQLSAAVQFARQHGYRTNAPAPTLGEGRAPASAQERKGGDHA